MVIGRDFLTRSVLECQFSQSRFRIVADFVPENPAGYTRLELGRSFHGLPMIAAQIEGLEAERAVVDLGSNLVCTMSERYARDAGLLCRPSSTTMSAGLEGRAVGMQITLRALRIGDHVLCDVPACVIPNWSLDAPVNLGWPAFGAFDLAFVFDRELRIRADETLLGAPLPRDRSGIGRNASAITCWSAMSRRSVRPTGRAWSRGTGSSPSMACRSIPPTPPPADALAGRALARRWR